MLNAPPRVDIERGLGAVVSAGLTPAALERELTELQSGPGLLTPHEYFYYRLYEPDVPRDQLWRFVGKLAQTMFHAVCNDASALEVAQNKAKFYAKVSSAGLRIPRVHAVYDPESKRQAADALRTPVELAAFLRDGARYPLFLKPARGMYSIGALSLAALNGDQVSLATGGSVDLQQVVDFVTGFGEDGFLFQERVWPHPILHAASGDTLGTVRMLVLCSSDGPHIESSVLKIASIANCADNYWRPGNMLAALNDNGVVQRVITGFAEATRAVTHHPDTGHQLIGLRIPCWEPLKSMALQAALLFPGIHTQSWDFAITANGPLVLELNPGGDLNLHQLARRRGALTDRYIKHLQCCKCRLIENLHGAALSD